MAAEMPVQDVLCEAMEYLSRLGSNLRIRSENLKEKKIRKDKLTNALAVQKAADKVLLICELSKKSLVNVETGVRKVLEHIDTSQASSSVGGKSTSSKNNERGKKKDEKPKYYYFDYKSRKLKIKNKISLKHYRSIKVLAKKMSKSVIEKYPVYYDCRLYRTRRKQMQLKEKDLESGQEKPESVESKEFIISSGRASSTEEPQNNMKTGILKTKENRRSSESGKSSRNSHKIQSPPKKKPRVIDSDSDDLDVSENVRGSGNHMINEDRGNLESKSNGTNTNYETKISDPPATDNSEFLAPVKSKNKNEREPKNEDISCDDIEITDCDNENASSIQVVKNDNEKNDTDDNIKKPIIKCVSLSKLLKPDVLQKDLPKASKTKTLQKVVGKRLEFDVTKKNKMLQTAKTKKDEFWAQKRKEVSAFKPKKLIINITRLPNFNSKFLIKNKLSKIIKDGKAICEMDKDKSDSIVQKTESELECIKKSKQSPELMALSDDDPDDELIAQANKIKKSLLNESDSDSDIDKHHKVQAESTVDKIKSALLNSDSDENEDASDILSNKQRTESTKDNKNSDNDNQDRISSPKSDINSNENSQMIKEKPGLDQSKAVSDSETAKNDLLDKSESDMVNDLPASLRNQKTPEKDLPSSKDDDAKKHLLSDCSDDKTEVPLSQRKTVTPQSKKKRIRESAEAKHALLRYSSGSETEDKQLKNSLNKIKLSLLEGLSDDEDKLKANKLDERGRSSQQSSSSDEDLFDKVKKGMCNDSQSSKIKKSNKHKKRLIDSESDEEKKRSSGDEHLSTSSSRKMVRSKAKPGNSSGHSTDAQDPIDKDIDGLTNLRTLNKLHRRNSDATDQSEGSKSSATRSRMETKKTGLISEDILEAESSMDTPSHNEDDALEEGLPSVALSGFNGGLEHLVKEDLLGESDSSESIKEENKEDSDEEERLNAKGRKANAIASSDSETGTVRKKDRDEDARLTDFEDSDDSEVTKRAKRKKKGSDSDGSAGSSDAGKKKRRRIKSVNDSDMSGSDTENEGKNKHGRKNIRRVMGKNQLEEATKKAAREERERVARIAERQKMYNNLQFDESGKPDEVVLDKVVLDFDPETKEPVIAVDRGLVKKLKPHQANGIKFMWDACFESAKRLKKDKGSGCILAHCMGLGKTLQVVALTHTLLAHDSLTKVHRVLVVCPLSTVLNWVNEFNMWLKHAERDSDIYVYELSRFKQNGERAFQLSQWFEHGGVCVLGYEMFRNLSADNNKKFRKKMLKNFQEALVDPGPDLVVCDEGHLLKNEKTSLSQSMNKVRTLRRIVLTGTPLQNNLKEYYCMVQFVKPNLLGKYNEYLNRFVNPITNGQYTDSTEHDIKIMKRRSHVLHKMLDGAVQRRDYGVLAPFLPPKHEYVLFITLTEVQTKLYQYYLDNFSRRPSAGKSSGFLFPDFQSLQRIWTHPLVLKYNSERYEVLQQKKRDKEEEDSEGSLVDFIDDESTPDESTSADSSDDSSECSDDSRKKSKKKKSSKKNKKSKDKDKDKDKESSAAARRRGTRANPIDLDQEDEKDDDIMEVKNENPTEWWIKMVEEDVLEDMRNSHKLVLLFDILRQCETIGDKLLVFSQSLYSLDLIEHFLGKVDEATQEGRIDEKLGNHVGSWSPGIDYFRLDGSTSCENRSIWCKNFNREDNPRARLFLISTRAGGLGINLVAANRVVIFDVSWNPSHDVQSIFRVYRFGQKKPCYVYRFLAMGTMEEKIYERQVTKQAISKRVIDEQQIDRHYAENDLAELYKFEAEPPSPRPIPPLPKDRLFAEMLREHEAQIYKYHEHDSLLENKEEETLSEEERKAAWEDFENEKNRPPPAPFPAPWPMHNGMVPNLIAQQQQQLAYAALSAMLRKDMPNVNDNQIRDMLPMIYNANPALMQKMSELFKYSQQMNMTPAMMAQSGMNPAAGGMGGMGGASGLQYEPPWQRQQQQQQQMRLQQLMAQQQSMGAASKYYAGGLGSRDPIAMALQQQRAREIMVGGAGVGAGTGAGRPRGRPPLQPRAPPVVPPPSADVVNLDSD